MGFEDSAPKQFLAWTTGRNGDGTTRRLSCLPTSCSNATISRIRASKYMEDSCLKNYRTLLTMLLTVSQPQRSHPRCIDIWVTARLSRTLIIRVVAQVMEPVQQRLQPQPQQTWRPTTIGLQGSRGHHSSVFS